MIRRHSFTKEKLPNRITLDYYENRILKSIERIKEGKGVSLYNLKDTPLDIAKTHIIEGYHCEIKQNLKLSLDLGLGHFKRVIADNNIEVSLNNVRYNLSSLEDSYGSSYFDWFFLFSIAQILGDEKSIIELNNMDLESINSVKHPFWSLVVNYLKSIALNIQEDVFNLIEQLRQEAVKGMGLVVDENQRKEKIFIENSSELYRILWSPIIELYDDIFYGNESQFNQTLESYLLNKREYIINQELEDDPRYWIDFPLLGCCAYAIDKGLTITVETEYAPQWVYRRDFT